MASILKNRKIQIAGAVVLLMIAAVVLVFAFQKTDYTSMKTDEKMINPPFEGVYWGMTKEEFCIAMNIEASALEEAPPFSSENWHYDMARVEENYNMSAEEMPLYDWYENHYYLTLSEPLFDVGNYSVDEKPLTVRLVFTDETTWNGKTVPPLLCAMFFKVSREELQTVSNGISVYYRGEESYSEGIGLGGSLNLSKTFQTAKTLSYMYTSGMSVEEIAAYDVPHMKREEQLKLTFPDFTIFRSTQPQVQVKGRVIDMGWTAEVDEEYVYVDMDAGYLAYYEWFLNELT